MSAWLKTGLNITLFIKSRHMHENIKTLPPAKSQLGRRDAEGMPLQCRFEAVGSAGLPEPSSYTPGELRRDAEQRGAAGRARSVRGIEAHLSSRLWRVNGLRTS